MEEMYLEYKKIIEIQWHKFVSWTMQGFFSLNFVM